MPKPTHVLDTSALIVYLKKEMGYKLLVELFKKDEIFFSIHIVNLGELYYRFWRSDGEIKSEKAWSLILEMPIRIVNLISESFIKRVARWKATQKILYADAFALAIAEEYGVPLITNDHQSFDPIDHKGLLEFYWLS